MAGGIIRRGHFVVVALPGAYGKPRPALVVQTDLFSKLHSVVVCPLTTARRCDTELFRLTVMPTPHNGLRAVSQVAIDKITAVPRDKLGDVIGQADDAFLRRVNRALALFLAVL